MSENQPNATITGELVDAPHPLVVMAALAGLSGGSMPPPRPAACPPGGPTDVRVYATLHSIATADGGLIGADGKVATIHSADKRVVLHDDAIIGGLLESGWLESVDHKTVRVTDRGNYWLDKFHKANRLKPGRGWGEWSRSR